MQAEKNPFLYALFVSFFPYVSSGPIVRYDDVGRKLGNETLGLITSERLARGLTLFVLGLFKKVIMSAAMNNIS